jgi:hypothetical protein
MPAALPPADHGLFHVAIPSGAVARLGDLAVTEFARESAQ